MVEGRAWYEGRAWCKGRSGEGVSRAWRKWGRVSRGRGVDEKVWEGVRCKRGRSGGGAGV